MIPDRTRRIVLVGFMGSGKTSVGKELAIALGWRFVDADEALEAHLGETIAQIFRTKGEEFFREEERRVMESLLQDEDVVIATGGGWAAQAGWAAQVPPGSATVWLQVAPAEAVRRVSTQPGKRPLIESDQPLHLALELVQVRSPSYALAETKVDTEGCSVEDVSARILEMLSGNDLRNGR